MSLRLLLGGLLPAILGVGLLVLPAPPEAPSHLEPSSVYLSSDGRMLRAFLNDDEQWVLPWPVSEPVPPRLETALVESEDRFFRRHPGVNPGALIRALVQNIRAGEIVSGGSTITMQLARILDPKPRTVWHKLRESVQALRLEFRYSKQEILKRYLAGAPYGGNVIGAPAAAWRYFGKTLADLTWAEAATLAVLPRFPGRVQPGRGTDELIDARNRLLARLADRGVISEADFERSRHEPVPREHRGFPFEAPHLTRLLESESTRDAGFTRTTIDLDLQREIERLAQVHASYLHTLGVANLAVLVAETESGKVRAYLGSADFADSGRLGEVDGVIAPRSSGSILKPFLYALAVDDGLLVPDTMLIDVPTHFGTFQPQNVDFAYFGMLRASEALQRSLNVPAVRLLSAYGQRDFYYFLLQAGVSTLFRTADDYGLPLILGGAETTLFDLVRLYRGLGLGGRFPPLSLVESDSIPGSDMPRLVSTGSSALVLEMLRGLTRPGESVWWERRADSWPIAWKTGTSYGNRDAWALGVTPDWTIGVWVGNFSGEENVNLRSTDTSAPLLLDIFELLPRHTRWFDVSPDEFRTETVCAETGYLAGDACEHTIDVRVPAGAGTLPLCPYHQFVFLDASGTHEVCSHCWGDEPPRRESRLHLPPDVVQYLAERGTVVEQIPPHNPICPVLGGATTSDLAILYPSFGSVLYLPRDFDGSAGAFTAHAASRHPDARLFWYLDGTYLGETVDLHTMGIEIGYGEHYLLIIDEQGTSESIEFQVLQQGRGG